MKVIKAGFNEIDRLVKKHGKEEEFKVADRETKVQILKEIMENEEPEALVAGLENELHKEFKKGLMGLTISIILFLTQTALIALFVTIFLNMFL